MRLTPSLTLGALLLAACGGNPENNAACGFSFVAGASMILQQANSPAAFYTQPPKGLTGTIPARVVGHGSGRAIAGTGPQGVVLGFEGDGFPTLPGFGVALVDDSSETVRGILIYEPQPTPGFPTIGTISGSRSTLPLFATRVHWGAFADPKCPMFSPVDTAHR